jgi:hypothetical protein
MGDNVWRDHLADQTRGADNTAATRALLGLTFNEADRVWLQYHLLSCISPAVTADASRLAVTCLGHVGRLDGAVVPEVMARLTELLDHPELGGTAEDALDDIAAFTTDGTPPTTSS